MDNGKTWLALTVYCWIPARRNSGQRIAYSKFRCRRYPGHRRLRWISRFSLSKNPDQSIRARQHARVSRGIIICDIPVNEPIGYIPTL